jgi:hypothetical protein
MSNLSGQSALAEHAEMPRNQYRLIEQVSNSYKWRGKSEAGIAKPCHVNARPNFFACRTVFRAEFVRGFRTVAMGC